MGICQSKEKISDNNNNVTMTNELQFTRYLYEKDEVKIALITSILNKNREEAEFWAYELYYSGFKNELSELFWSICYDFYYVINPKLYKYLIKKLKYNLSKNTEKEKNDVAMIINNFIIRQYTLDVFFMRIFVKNFDFDKKYINDYTTSGDFTFAIKELKILLEERDYMMLSSFILDDVKQEHLLNTLTVITLFFTEKGLSINYKDIIDEYNKILLSNTTHKRLILLANLIHLYGLYLKGKKIIGKNIHVIVEPEDVVMYETIEVNLQEKENGIRIPILSAYKILPVASLYHIDKYNFLSLFTLKRDNTDIKTSYYFNWLYHASFSPLWKERIQKYDGIIDEEKKTVLFKNESLEEEFYNYFNYEPDEQKCEVQNKNIQPIETTRTWLSFYKEYNKNGIIDLDEELLSELNKTEY
jgi:hypothetical protein